MLVIRGIQEFIRQFPVHAVEIRPLGVSRILLLFLCRFLPIFLELVSLRVKEEMLV